MGLKEYLWKNWKASDFTFPSDDMLLSLIEEYAGKNGETIEFISTGKPMVFRLGDKDTYEAEPVLEYCRQAQGYSLHCRQRPMKER